VRLLVKKIVSKLRQLLVWVSAFFTVVSSWTTFHIFTGAHYLVNEKQLLCKYWCYIEELSLDHVVIPTVGYCGGKGLSR